MIDKIKILFVSVLFTSSYMFAQSGLGTLKGTVKDDKTSAVIVGAKVMLLSGTSIKGSTLTDDKGEFQIDAIMPGSYDLKVTNKIEGYQDAVTQNVLISTDKITFLEKLTLAKPENIKNIDEVKVSRYKIPLINKDGGATGATVGREDIARMPIRSAAGVAQSVGGVNTNEGSGEISVRGSRSDATYFYIDGIKVRGSSNLPKAALEEVSVITGGVPANYGDVTGGIISVTTRGPSALYFGSIELVTSGAYFKGKNPNGYDGKVIGLDKFGYNLVEGMLSGPLWMQKIQQVQKQNHALVF